MDAPVQGQDSEEAHSAQQQPQEDLPEQHQAEDDIPSTPLQGEAEEYLSQMRRTLRCADAFKTDMMAAINELSQSDVRPWLYLEYTCDHIRDLMTEAKQQSAALIEHEKDQPDRTQGHIQKMMGQLMVFRRHRKRVVDLWLMQMMLSNPISQELNRELVRHLRLLRDDAQGLLDAANRKDQVGGQQGQAAGHEEGQSHSGSPHS
jgi:hypothetical protein